ncbi:hypothetical protein GIB67_008610 [Kingdonia uniflora]|uniref:Retrotransposon Copia-like N-terminal domain-containing protein n=1 Tax=Kingdonia uniflora TaxID=39325 RepID=A0A7J7M4S5_9MAGN|nr:hypothetical protein GIB67_008610 [Kingdonia uniflora]
MVTSSNTPTPIPGIPNLAQVAIKLTKTNFLLWKSQLLLILYRTDMLGMVDGTLSAPDETITMNSKTTINLEFLERKKKDQILLSWLHATITISVFAQMVGYKTSRVPLDTIQQAYTSQTYARYYQIKYELSNIRKVPLSNRYLVGYVLDGIDLDYDVIITYVQTMPSTPNFEELYSMLANREKRLEGYQGRNNDRVYYSNNYGRGYAEERGSHQGDMTTTCRYHGSSPDYCNACNKPVCQATQVTRQYVKLEHIDQRIKELIEAQSLDSNGDFTKLQCSPIAKELFDMEVPKGFHTPKIRKLRGTDLKEHIQQFRDSLGLYSNLNHILCHLFTTSLPGKPLRWFHSLPEDSIFTFDQQQNNFVKTYAHNKDKE